MKQLKETPEFQISSSPRFRYWTTPPEFLSLRVSEIEAVVPKANWIASEIPDHVFQLPASVVLSKNVPRISLRQLAEALPEHVLPSDGVVRLPASRLAAGYRLVENSEELPVEVPEPEPEQPVAPLEETSRGEEPMAFPPLDPSPVPPPPASTEAPETPSPTAPKKVSPRAAELPGKMPPRREGSFIGLPIFRRKSVVEPPASTEAPAGEAIPAGPIPIPPFTGIRLPRVQGSPIPVPPPPVEVSDPEPPVEVPEAPSPEPTASTETVESLAADEPVVEATPAEQRLSDDEPAPQEVPPDFAVEDLPAEEPLFVSVSEFEAESMPSHDGEITEQEPLQALFLTEEILSVGRVIELCGSLPGINSCVLAQGSLVVASHNVAEGIDLVSMSAHAAEMLQSMRESSARMGVGAVPAVTLHTEKGVISFFHRDDLTMLVFHKDRGFVPGVREKMAAVLGELTKSRLTLPAGNNG